MGEGTAMARFAAVLADRSRATICVALLDGRAWTAGELARHVGIGQPTTSEHLSVLVQAGMLAEERQGRHRYVRLAGAHAAQLVEDLASLAGSDAPPSGLRAVRARRQLATGRTCYDHLAGRLGVALFDAMVARGLVVAQDGLVLTADGKQWLADLGWAPDDGSRRPVVRTCLDWTERRHHLGGQAGAGLQQQLMARRWVEPRPGSRAVTVTAEGREALRDLLQLMPD